MILILAAVIGWIAGYFLAFPVLVTISIICIAIGFWMSKTLQEMASLLTIAFVHLSIIGNIVMWVTHYVVEKNTWFGDFVHTNILR